MIKNTSFKREDEKIPLFFQDLTAGEKAVVEFHEKDGKYIADTIRISDKEHG